MAERKATLQDVGKNFRSWDGTGEYYGQIAAFEPYDHKFSQGEVHKEHYVVDLLGKKFNLASTYVEVDNG